MRFRLFTTLSVLTVVLVLAIAGVAQASVPVQPFVSFDPAAGQFPEGVAVDVRGNVYATLTGPVNEIVRIAPDGSRSVVAHFDVPGFGPLGLAVSASGKMYVAMSTFDAATRGVYRVLPDGGSRRLPGTDGILFPNGLALDARGNLYATDSIGGSVWKIPPHGTAHVWSDSTLLAGTGALSLGFPLGANGIAIRGHTVVVTNTEGGSLVAIPVLRDGSAGTASVLAQDPALFGADGLALDVFGNAFVAVNPQSTLVRVDLAGHITVLATAADGLDNPASLAFGTSMAERGSLFITNFALFTTVQTPGVLKASVGVPGQPLR